METAEVIKEPCDNCRGKGTVRKQPKIKVKIPAGIDNGQTVVLRGEGEPGQKGGPKGDLYITVGVKNIVFILEKEIMYYVIFQLQLLKLH